MVAELFIIVADRPSACRTQNQFFNENKIANRHFLLSENRTELKKIKCIF